MGCEAGGRERAGAFCWRSNAVGECKRARGERVRLMRACEFWRLIDSAVIDRDNFNVQRASSEEMANEPTSREANANAHNKVSAKAQELARPQGGGARRLREGIQRERIAGQYYDPKGC